MKINQRFKNLISDGILYIIATGLNRGYFLIISPLLLTFLSVKEYGVFTLTFSLSQMFIPFLTLSGTAGILREGSLNIKVGVFLLEKFIYIVFFNTLLLLLLYYFFGYWLENWIFYSIIFGSLNGINELFLSFFRTVNTKKTYFLVTLSRIILIIIGILVAKSLKFSLESTFILLIFLQSFLILWLILNLLQLYIKKYNKTSIEISSVLKYTIFIIPHGLVLWIINSSDKLIIKALLGNEKLGIYSIAYTIASLQLLINSGIGIALPQIIYKNYIYWLKENIRLRVITFLFLISIFLFIIIVMGIKIDKQYFHLLIEHEKILKIINFILPGLFLVGVYQYYSIYIFYHKKTKNIFYAGVGVALVNLFLNYFLIKKYGILGAAYTTFISYIIYIFIIVLLVMKIEKKLKMIYKDGIYIFVYTFLLYAIIWISSK